MLESIRGRAETVAEGKLLEGTAVNVLKVQQGQCSLKLHVACCMCLSVAVSYYSSPPFMATKLHGLRA